MTYPTVRLNNNIDIPRLGLGVYRSRAGKETRDAVSWALEFGYRLIDTAAVYGNEASVGEAVRESTIPRDQIFITTKLASEDTVTTKRSALSMRASIVWASITSTCG